MQVILPMKEADKVIQPANGEKNHTGYFKVSSEPYTPPKPNPAGDYVDLMKSLYPHMFPTG